MFCSRYKNYQKSFKTMAKLAIKYDKFILKLLKNFWAETVAVNSTLHIIKSIFIITLPIGSSWPHISCKHHNQITFFSQHSGLVLFQFWIQLTVKNVYISFLDLLCKTFTLLQIYLAHYWFQWILLNSVLTLKSMTLQDAMLRTKPPREKQHEYAERCNAYF